MVAAKLAVGADGAESWARRAAGIEALNASYSQLGIVANFSCARAHRNIAYQWFRSDGVLAYLPLAGRRVSIVWSTREGQARELLALAPAVFCARVSEAGHEALGALELLTPPAAFPLSRMLVNHLVERRRWGPRKARLWLSGVKMPSPANAIIVWHAALDGGSFPDPR